MSNKKYILGDCMEYLKEYKDNHFDLAVVDPPYGIGEIANRNNTGDRNTKKWKSPKSQKYKPFNDNKPPTKEYFIQLFRVSKNQIIWGSNNFTKHLPKSSGWIVWNKKVNEKEHLSMAELAYTSFDIRLKMFTYLWAGFKKAKQIKRIHPTQKPVALYRWILQNYAKKNDLILDTHVGSASSLIACEIEGFDYVGFEKDKDYYRDSNKRIKQHLSQITMF